MPLPCYAHAPNPNLGPAHCLTAPLQLSQGSRVLQGDLLFYLTPTVTPRSCKHPQHAGCPLGVPRPAGPQIRLPGGPARPQSMCLVLAPWDGRRRRELSRPFFPDPLKAPLGRESLGGAPTPTSASGRRHGGPPREVQGLHSPSLKEPLFARFRPRVFYEGRTEQPVSRPHSRPVPDPMNVRSTGGMSGAPDRRDRQPRVGRLGGLPGKGCKA